MELSKENGEIKLEMLDYGLKIDSPLAETMIRNDLNASATTPIVGATKLPITTQNISFTLDVTNDLSRLKSMLILIT